MSTLDFVIADNDHLMALLCVLSKLIHKDEHGILIGLWIKLKFKMKVGYTCWKSGLVLKKQFRQAIRKTIEERLLVVSHNIRQFLRHEKDANDDFYTMHSDRGDDGPPRIDLRDLTAKAVVLLDRGMEKSKVLSMVKEGALDLSVDAQ